MSLALSISDNADGTGGVATISGNTPGSTNTCSTQYGRG